MKLAVLLVVGAVACTPVAPSVTLPPIDPLAGLWSAVRELGPEVRGALHIEERDGAMTAAIAGQRAAVTREGDRLSFALPDNRGSFRGRLDAGRIVGHWIQPPGVLARAYASPVTLEPRGEASWHGEVVPLDDPMTLLLRVAPDHTAFLRNPERNIGVFVGVRRVERDGDHIRLVGGRRDEPDGILAEGRLDVAAGTLSIDLPNLGGTYDFRRADAAAEAVFYPRGRTPAPYVYAPPPALDDGWPVGTLDEAGVDRAAITAFVEMLDQVPIDSIEASDLHAVLIARHGRLVLEEYFHGFTRDRPHDTRSAAKSLTAFLIGAAIHGGAPLDTTTPVYATMGRSDRDPRKRAMTLGHLLTMSSGYDCDDNSADAPGSEEKMQQQTEEPDWVRFTLDTPMAREPGTKAVYCGSDPNLAGGVLARKTGEWLPDLFREHLAEPLGIRRYHMNLMPSGDPYMGGGVHFEPRDFMKLGQLIVDDGRWQGKQVIGADFVRAATDPQVKIGDRLYGYFWWIQDYPYRGRTVRAVFAGGNGGQIVMAIPDLELVIAFYGGNYSSRASFIPQRTYVPEHILPAVEPAVR